MSLVFRALLNHTPWAKKTEDEEWLPDDDIRADALKSLKSENNALSIYLFDGESNIDRVIAAYSAARSKVENLDYAIFSEDFLKQINITYTNNAAKGIPDTVVSSWHYDLVQLTGSKVLSLAKVIREHGKINRKSSPEVGKLINQAIDSNIIDKLKLDKNLIADLDKPRYK